MVEINGYNVFTLFLSRWQTHFVFLHEGWIRNNIERGLSTPIFASLWLYKRHELYSFGNIFRVAEISVNNWNCTCGLRGESCRKVTSILFCAEHSLGHAAILCSYLDNVFFFISLSFFVFFIFLVAARSRPLRYSYGMRHATSSRERAVNLISAETP